MIRVGFSVARTSARNSFFPYRSFSLTAKSVPSTLLSHIDGASTSSTSNQHIDVVHPGSGEVITKMDVALQPEIDQAVAAASAAQREWAEVTGMERGRILRKAATLFEEHNDRLAELEALDTGRPMAETLYVDAVSARDCLDYMAGLGPTIAGQHIDMGGDSFGYTRREPLGVTVGIGAWNYPVQGMMWKAAPALISGNAMIFKPSEETPLTALAVAELLLEAGLPKGLFSVVLGAGQTGELLAQHPGVSKVSFTGSAATGKKVYAAAAGGLKSVTMELGGKSPLIVFDDADLDNAVSGAMIGNWYSSGQVCSNGTRVFVHRSVKARFLEKLLERTAKMKIGDPMDPTTDVGAMISEKHMNKVLGYIEQGKAGGARLLCGGERVTVPGLENGYYLSPAVFDECSDDMTIVKEEIFGMVMSVLTFDDEEEVVARANDTPYGLSAGVFTKDITRAHRVVKRLQAGTTWINNYNLAPVELPWGGFKESGVGRENGVEAINHWTQLKSVYVEMGDVDCPY